MQFYRCKCGKSTSHTSRGVARCQSCPECKSDLAMGPDGHREPEPHRWVPQFDSNTGARKADVCTACMSKRKDGGQVDLPPPPAAVSP